MNLKKTTKDKLYCTNPSGLDDIVKQSDFCSYGERKEE